MSGGEDFLGEYRYLCSFDGDLKSGSSDSGDGRHGAALWHDEESGILGKKKDANGNYQDVIQYQTLMHIPVTAPGKEGVTRLRNWDLEQSSNRDNSTIIYFESQAMENKAVLLSRLAPTA
jgi:hypothetical protein